MRRTEPVVRGCKEQSCPYKLKCFRYTSKHDEYLERPFVIENDVFCCDYYIGNLSRLDTANWIAFQKHAKRL